MTRQTALFSGLLAALLIAAHPAASAQDAAKAARFYEDALKRYEAKDLAGAIIQLKNALQADKNQLSVQVLLGRALLADSQPVAAEVAFTEALRLGVDRTEVCVPLAEALTAQGKQRQMLADARLSLDGLTGKTRRDLLLLRAGAYADIGDPSNGLANLTEARKLDPGAIESWLAEVPLRIRARQWNEALAAANQALKLQPDNADALYQKASVMHASGNLREALVLYTSLLAKTPRHFEALIARAGILADLNNNDGAMADITTAQAIQPKDPRAIYLRALVSERRGDKAGNHAALKQVTDLLDPAPIETIAFRTQLLMLNGLAHYGLGELGKAKPYLELAARQQPGSPLLKLLAHIAIAEPDLNRAQDLLEEYTRSHPGDGQALLMLASLYVSQGRGEKAATLMQEALKRNDTPGMRAVLGAGLLQIGQTEQAMGQLEKAYKANPKQLYGALALVKAYARAGRLADALRVCGEVVHRQPNDPAIGLLDATLRQTAGDLSGARQGFERVLRLNPRLFDAQLGLARIDALTRSFDAAEKRLRELLRTNERSADVQFELALLNELRGKDDEAEKWLRGAVEASSAKGGRADFALVEWYLRKGQPAQALQAAKVLSAKLPDDIDALRVLASAQLASGDAPKAKQTLTQASRKASFNATQLAGIAALQIKAQDLQGAAYSLDKALNGSPNNPDVLALQAEVELLRNDPGAAEAKARQLLALNAKSEAAHLLLADVARRRNQPQQEVDYLRKLQDIQPRSQNVARLVTAQSRQGHAQDARASADAWLRRNPRDVLVLKAIADAEARAGLFPGARQRYEAALKISPQDAEALNNLANVLIRLKDPGAVQVAEQALNLRPNEAALLDTAGWANLQAGKLDRALQLLRDARLRAPEQPEIRYHLGLALARAGRNGEARTELQAATQAGRTFEGLDEAKRTLATLN
jgi:putative PEP-CTERM system TPR-repeat lipoprotein